MTIEQLRVFVAVAERGHVTEGARALNLAQSAASHAIASLEARHDVLLFDPIGRRIALTEAGAALLVQARRILAEVEHAEQTLAEFGALERGVLSLYASQTIAGYWLPPRLVAFRRAYPRIEIRLTIGNTAEVAEAVESATAKLGFVEGAVKKRKPGKPRRCQGPAGPRRRSRSSVGRGSFAQASRPSAGRMGAARGRIGHAIGVRTGAEAARRPARGAQDRDRAPLERGRACSG